MLTITFNVNQITMYLLELIKIVEVVEHQFICAIDSIIFNIILSYDI